MAKELPILPSTAQPADETQAEQHQYSRVFCQKENSPPLRLLLEYLKSHGQTPITPPNMDDAMLDEWAWVQVTCSASGIEAPIKTCLTQRRSCSWNSSRLTTTSKQDSHVSMWSARGLCL